MAARGLRNARAQAARLGQWLGSVDMSGRPISTVSSSLQNSPSEKVEEAETVDTPKPKDRTKILVIGGSGFVGSHVCQEALQRGFPVLSLSRSGRPPVAQSWMNDVTWLRGSVFDSEKWSNYLKEVSAVISCVGGFGSNATMRKVNGDANIAAVNVSADKGVHRFVYISVAEYGFPPFVLRGYFEGKRATEEAIRLKFPYSGVILRPGFIHGNRQVGTMNLPLSAIGTPLELVMRNLKSATQIPIVGPLLIPPVKATAVAKAAVRAAVDNAVPPGILDVWGIMRLGDSS